MTMYVMPVFMASSDATRRDFAQATRNESIDILLVGNATGLETL